MPWLEPESGDVGHGVGGGYASRNNVNFSRGGFGGWRDRDTAAFANGDDGWIVSVWNKVTNKIERVEFPVSGAAVTLAATPLVERAYSRNLARVLAQVEVPANTIYAGGGVVAAWLGSRDESRGLYTTAGLRLPDGGLLGAGLDGAVGYKPLYQSNGPSNVRELNGDDWQLTPGHASALQLLGQRRAIWMEGFTVQVANLPQPLYRNEGGIWAAQAAFVGGEWWTAYYSGKRGVILHPFRSSERCFPLVPKGDAWHRITPMGPNVLRFAISRTEGEGAGDIWGYDLDVTTGIANPLPFGNQPQTPTVFEFVLTDTVNADPPVPVVYPTYSFTHPLVVVPFKDPENTSGAKAEILVNENDQTATRPLFVADDTLGSTWRGELLGIYTEGMANLSKVIADAAKRKTRVLWCHDSDAPLVLPTGLRPWDIVMMELYWYKKKGETLAQAVARWRRDQPVLLSWPGDCGLVPMFYCMGGLPPNEDLTPAEVLQTLAYLNEFANRSSRIKILSPFEYLRGNGITAHPELLRSYKDLLAAAPPGVVLTPVPPDPPDPPKPEPKPFFTHTKGKAVTEIDGKTVVLRGPKGMLMRPDKPGTGIWGKDADPKGTWRGSVFDVSDPGDDRTHYTAKKLADGRYLFTNVKENCRAGEDAGWYTPDVLQQFYHQPTGHPEDKAGDLERWACYDGNNNGAVEAQCEQTTDENHPAGPGKKFFAYPLAVEVV